MGVTGNVIAITQGKGFSMVFENGNTVSVQFGFGNYCENQEKFELLKEPVGLNALSKDAEVAAWTAENKWYDFGDDKVRGWLSSDKVSSFIAFVAQSDLTEDRWI